MTEYQKTYIELKKQFVATNEGPDSVRALYTFKEELEQSEDQQAKEVLVDVYDLLDFKKDAYELLCQIGNRSDLAEQFVGVLLKVQQVIYIHQHFLGLLILTLLKFFLEGI